MSDEQDQRHRNHLARLQFQWQGSRNPLFIWHAYRWCRAWKLPLPDWVLAYLDRVARRLFEFERKPPTRTSDACADALGMDKGGRGTFFADMPPPGKPADLDIAVAVAAEMAALRANGHSRGLHDAAFAAVARYTDLSKSTVRKYYKRFNDL